MFCLLVSSGARFRIYFAKLSVKFCFSLRILSGLRCSEGIVPRVALASGFCRAVEAPEFD